MGSYLMMLYVSLEQENAVKQLFLEKGWPWVKHEPSALTDINDTQHTPNFNRIQRSTITPSHERISEVVETGFASVSRDVTAVTEGVTAVTRGVTALAKDVTAVTRNITSVTKDIVTFARYGKAFARNVSTLASDIDNLARDVTAVTTDVTTLAKNVTTVARDVTVFARDTYVLSTDKPTVRQCSECNKDAAVHGESSDIAKDGTGINRIIQLATDEVIVVDEGINSIIRDITTINSEVIDLTVSVSAADVVEIGDDDDYGQEAALYPPMNVIDCDKQLGDDIIEHRGYLEKEDKEAKPTLTPECAAFTSIAKKGKRSVSRSPRTTKRQKAKKDVIVRQVDIKPEEPFNDLSVDQKTIQTNTQLTEHQLKIEADVKVEEEIRYNWQPWFRTWECDICGEIFEGTGARDEHYLTAHSERPEVRLRLWPNVLRKPFGAPVPSFICK